VRTGFELEGVPELFDLFELFIQSVDFLINLFQSYTYLIEHAINLVVYILLVLLEVLLILGLNFLYRQTTGFAFIELDRRFCVWGLLGLVLFFVQQLVLSLVHI
jgi:hypothetical protein